ncbi:hypothetical protein [Pantoea sp. CCBC3-3-1]|uniref:hypothetical protein n=1 Tax=Pantoea sp. CCBC3-3-1 TaxID=2490851 RepID=UPI0011BD9AFC|nr:hypothetical protein [Pantoea sp. CCBC3-3-1]
MVKQKRLIKFGYVVVVVVGFQFSASILSGADIISGWWEMPENFSHWAVVVITSLGCVRFLNDIYSWLLKKFDKSNNHCD